jgi:hypothetical protein
MARSVKGPSAPNDRSALVADKCGAEIGAAAASASLATPNASASAATEPTTTDRRREVLMTIDRGPFCAGDDVTDAHLFFHSVTNQRALGLDDLETPDPAVR